MTGAAGDSAAEEPTGISESGVVCSRQEYSTEPGLRLGSDRSFSPLSLSFSPTSPRSLPPPPLPLSGAHHPPGGLAAFSAAAAAAGWATGTATAPACGGGGVTLRILLGAPCSDSRHHSGGEV